MTSSFGRRFSDERATMAGEKELTMDIYGGSPSPPPGLSPRDDLSFHSTTANGVQPTTRITNGDAPTGSGSGRRKNESLPSGMSQGGSSSGRSGKYSNAGKKQRLGRMTPIWRRIISRSTQAAVIGSDRDVTYGDPQTNGVLKTSQSDNNRTTFIASNQQGARLNGERLPGDGQTTANDVQRSSLTETRRPGSGQEQQQQPQHLNVILGAPAGFRDSSFDESDTVSKPTKHRLPRIGTNADGLLSPVSASYPTSFAEVKKRPAPPVPPAKPLLSPPQASVKNDFNYRKRPAAKVLISSRAEQSTAITLQDTQPSSSNTDVANKPAAGIGKIVIPEVFRQSKNQTNIHDFRPPSSSRPEVGSGSGSIFRRSSFLQHLESVVGRYTPSSSAVSTITRGAVRSDNNIMHNSSAAPEDLNYSSGSLVSRLFHSALSNHYDDSSGGGKKNFKFLVPGIDIPAESTAEQQDDDEDGRVPASRVRKGGFSYLSDVNVAAEVTRRAADMTAKRQHQESVVEESVRDRGLDGVDEDEAALRAARARLHAPQPRPDLPPPPPPALQSPAHIGAGRQQMLLDIVDAARKRARKNGTDSAEFDDTDYLQEADTNQNRSDSQTQNLLCAGYNVGVTGGKLQQNGTSEPSNLSPNLQYEILRDVKNSRDVITPQSRPEVPRDVSQTSGVFDNGPRVARRELNAPDFHHGPAAAKFRSADAAAEGVMSYRAARQALRTADIDRQQLNADRLAGDEVRVVASADDAGGARNGSSYLPPYLSAAPVTGNPADNDAGVKTRYGGQRDDIRRQSAASSTSSSSEDEPESWWISDNEDPGGAGAYTVSIVGGQVHARRLPRQRSAARNHRRRSSLRRRPHVVCQQRPVSVEVWSSGGENGGGGEFTRRPIRRHFVAADRRPLPLTVDTNANGVIGHVYNANITQSTTESVQRRVLTDAASNRDILHYFSDPEPHLGPYKTGVAVSHHSDDANLNSSSSFDFDAASRRRTFSAVPPPQSVYVPAPGVGETIMTAVDPQLRDVGTKNRRYFVRMLLNATRGRRREVQQQGVVNSTSESNSGGGVMGMMPRKSWYGSAPQLLQLGDDVTDQYTGAPLQQQQRQVGNTSSTWFTTTAMQQANNVRHTSVYDVTSPPHTDHSAYVARRPQSTPPWTTSSSHVGRSVVTSRLPQAAVDVVTAERRRRPLANDGTVNRSTVEFDIELEPVTAGRTQRHLDLLSTGVHANGLPRYAIQLNETMRFDIDSPNSSDPQRTTSNPQLPTYDHGRRQRQPRRQRPPAFPEQQYSERQRTVVDVRPAVPYRARRRRQNVPVVPVDDDDEVDSDDDDVESSPIYNDDDDEMLGPHRVPTTGRRPFAANNDDLLRVPHDEDKINSRRATTTGNTTNDLPRVVRGSILIRNSIDTAGTPRHIDVVTTGDTDPDAAGGSDTAVVVEDNTNMFDGLYRQSRENPIYLSDPEQSPDDDDDVDRSPVVNSRLHTSYTRSRQQNRPQKGRTKNNGTVVDDFDKKVNITRGMQNPSC